MLATKLLLFSLRIRENISVGELIFFSIIIALAFTFDKYGKKNDDPNYVEIVEKINFNKYARLNQKNIMKATICLATHMLFKDKIDFPEKISYIKKYFYKKFPSSYIYFPDSFSFYLKNPVKIDSVCTWLNKRLKTKEDKINILYFLAGISMIDGLLTKREYTFLIEIQQNLQLDKKDLDAIVAMYTRNEEKKQEEEESKINRNLERRTQAQLQIYYTILELPITATFDEIKKSYRKLVMLNHPDKYERAGKDMMNLAYERFLKIQEAYEYLEKLNVGK